MIFYRQEYIKKKLVSSGMALTELILAISMLAAFTGIFVIVTSFTTRYFTANKSSLEGSRGVLIDHHELYMSMDKLAEVLSQPGFTLAEINEIINSCEYAPQPPKRIWNLPGKEKQSMPDGYKICLFSTSAAESNILELVLGTQDARPGIYILYASPLEDRVSLNQLPVRRLFCRPKPYC